MSDIWGVQSSQEGFAKEIRTVKYLDENKPYLNFVSLSQDVEAIKDTLPMTEEQKDLVSELDSFFVEVKGGDYTEVWGMEGIVPYLSKKVYRIK